MREFFLESRTCFLIDMSLTSERTSKIIIQVHLKRKCEECGNFWFFLKFICMFINNLTSKSKLFSCSSI